MKIIFNVLLIVLCLLIGLQQAIIVIYFKLNRDAIEQKFCINRNKPELQCHGTCHLKQQLQKTENPESASLNNYPKIEIFPVSTTDLKVENSITVIQKIQSYYKETLYINPYRKILIPPPII